MRDEHRHAVVCREAGCEVAAGACAGVGVERGERLVEEEQGRIGGEGSGQRHPGPLARRELVRPRRCTVTETDPLELETGALAGPVTVGAAAARPVGDVVDRAQVREEEAVGQHEADPALLRCEPAPPVVPRLATDSHMTLGEGEHPGQGEHGRRLAAAVGSEDADDLACRGGEGDVHLDRPARQADPGVETLDAMAAVGDWPHRSHLPRSTPSTSTLTPSSMMLIEIATCGSRSSST